MSSNSGWNNPSPAQARESVAKADQGGHQQTNMKERKEQHVEKKAASRVKRGHLSDSSEKSNSDTELIQDNYVLPTDPNTMMMVVASSLGQWQEMLPAHKLYNRNPVIFHTPHKNVSTGAEEGKILCHCCQRIHQIMHGQKLLERGYVVHATIGDPENLAKTSHLLSLPGAKERLHIFKADVYQLGSFDSAIEGCDFLINLATALDPQREVIDPAVEGTLNILRACKEAKSVRRVVHTSSLAAAFPLNEEGEFKELLDESCWTPVNYITRKNLDLKAYSVSKTLAEQAALRFGAEQGIEVVTVLVAMVGGISLAPTFPASVSVMLAPLTGSESLHMRTVGVGDAMFRSILLWSSSVGARAENFGMAVLCGKIV
ncbi:hypothetical protein KI387_031415 [Taxus chinensis]|uniref:NAD-dependent epimerase/dehydratase domain-containing protein n=1 Tax=Taxus chinensis TaxID=29808 RepID=A0AA38CNI9_TAXCH|nr:hypothetical protein KI387_031415 [Taxus chinensis]